MYRTKKVRVFLDYNRLSIFISAIVLSGFIAMIVEWDDYTALTRNYKDLSKEQQDKLMWLERIIGGLCCVSLVYGSYISTRVYDFISDQEKR